MFIIFTIYLGLGLFMSCLWDLFFIFIIILLRSINVFIMIIIYNDLQRVQAQGLRGMQ